MPALDSLPDFRFLGYARNDIRGLTAPPATVIPAYAGIPNGTEKTSRLTAEYS